MTSRKPHPVDIRVGANLRALRQQRGYSQTQLAEVLGLTFQQVQKYEKGANRISASRLFEIAQFFNIGVASFFEGCGDQKETSSILSYSQAALDVAAALDKVDQPKIKKQIKQLVLAISKSRLLG